MKRHWMSVCALAVLGGGLALYAEEDAKDKPAEEKPAAEAEKSLDPRFESLQAKVSYGIGQNIAHSLLRQGFDAQTLGVDLDLLAEGFKDVLGGKESQISEEQIVAAMQAFQEQQTKKLREPGEMFLAENAKAEGVKSTESGLQYKVMKEGKGDKPKPTDTVKVHYRGTFINGEEFDSSYKKGEPVSFQLDGVIAGWTEGVGLMNVGSKYRLFIPYALAYGEQGRPPRIPPFSVLVFEIELLEIEK